MKTSQGSAVHTTDYVGGFVYVDGALSFFGSRGGRVVKKGAGANQGDSRPAAYLNFILFDRNYKVLDAGWQLAPAATFTKQKLSFPTLNIEEPGFVYVWLSYEDESNNCLPAEALRRQGCSLTI